MVAGTDKNDPVHFLATVELLGDAAGLFSVVAHVNKDTETLLAKEAGKFQHGAADEQGVRARGAEESDPLQLGTARFQPLQRVAQFLRHFPNSPSGLFADEDAIAPPRQRRGDCRRRNAQPLGNVSDRHPLLAQSPHPLRSYERTPLIMAN